MLSVRLCVLICFGLGGMTVIVSASLGNLQRGWREQQQTPNQRRMSVLRVKGKDAGTPPSSGTLFYKLEISPRPGRWRNQGMWAQKTTSKGRDRQSLKVL